MQKSEKKENEVRWRKKKITTKRYFYFPVANFDGNVPGKRLIIFGSCQVFFCFANPISQYVTSLPTPSSLPSTTMYLFVSISIKRKISCFSKPWCYQDFFFFFKQTGIFFNVLSAILFVYFSKKWWTTEKTKKDLFLFSSSFPFRIFIFIFLFPKNFSLLPCSFASRVMKDYISCIPDEEVLRETLGRKSVWRQKWKQEVNVT